MKPGTPGGVVNSSFWRWLVFVLVGLVFLAILPARARAWATAVVLLGGWVYVKRAGGGWQGILRTFETMGKG